MKCRLAPKFCGCIRFRKIAAQRQKFFRLLLALKNSRAAPGKKWAPFDQTRKLVSDLTGGGIASCRRHVSDLLWGGGGYSPGKQNETIISFWYLDGFPQASQGSRRVRIGSVSFLGQRFRRLRVGIGQGSSCFDAGYLLSSLSPIREHIVTAVI